MRSAVIYARFSSSKQREASIEDQLRVCRQWCSEHGYRVVAEYCDQAMSGRTDDRPAFQQMIANAGESQIVLVYMMDRFSRDVYDAPIYKKRLRDRGVSVVSATEAMPDGPEAILVESIYEAMAAMESAQTSRRTKRGMEGNALKCRTNGVRVFGYRKSKDDTYEVDPTEAAFVREAFERKIAHEPVSSIARDFAQRGVRTYQGRPCGYTMVYRMLRSEKYTGVYKFGDVRVEGGMPQIIDRETFMEAQRVQPRKRRSEESWGSFALSGRVVCGACAMNMPGVSGRGRNNRKYEYYACQHCRGIKPVRRDWLEDEIGTRIRMLVSDRSEALRVAQSLASAWDGQDTAARMKAAEKALSDAQRGIDNMVMAIESGLFTPEMKSRMDALQLQRDRARADLKALEAEGIDPERLADFLQEGCPNMTQAQLLDAFVWQVVVTSDSVTVTLNYDDEKSEPAGIEFQRVLTSCVWLPLRKLPRNTEIACSEGFLLLRFPRAA